VRVKFSGHVEEDLDLIADWIAHDNPQRAASLVREFREAFRRISQNPLVYRRRPEIGRDTRIAVVHPYVILFRVRKRLTGEFVQIERVVHGGRDLQRLQ
jgi:toxin ParE1/3/4